MFAAIPYFALRVYTFEVPGLGQIPIDPWATLVCLAFVVGMEMARYRAIKLGMDVRDIVDACVFIVVSGFVMGHIITVVGYHPERLTMELETFAIPGTGIELQMWGGLAAILRLWEGFSSFGGFLGAVIGALVFFKYIRPKDDFWRYADVVTFGFPFGWIFGRAGCAVVHDHIGALTTFPLAMQFPEGHFAEGLRHELGLYEMLLFIGVSAAFWHLGKVDRPPGFWTGTLAVFYAPIRFGLDFLRNDDLQYQDLRYAGLTPAQWGCFVMFGLGVWVLMRIDWPNFKPWPMDSEPHQDLRSRGLQPPEPAAADEAPAEPEPSA